MWQACVKINYLLSFTTNESAKFIYNLDNWYISLGAVEAMRLFWRPCSVLDPWPLSEPLPYHYVARVCRNIPETSPLSRLILAFSDWKSIAATVGRSSWKFDPTTGSEFPRIATTRPLFNRSSCEIFELCFNWRRSYAAEITEITVEAYTTIIISPESSVTFVGLLQFPIALFMQYAQISLTFTVLCQCQRHILNATLT